jgi:predicted transcriptional regulator
MTDDITLEVRVQPTEKLEDEVLEKVEAAERGEEVEPLRVLNLPNKRELSRLMSEKNLELLEAIKEEEPSSMRELSKIVDRDFREVHRNLKELEKLEVVEFEEKGQSKKPVVGFDSIEVKVDLAAEA